MPLEVRSRLTDEQRRAADPPILLQARGVTRRFGSALALRGVDLVIHRGERIALLGPNGAGKTTLIRVLATALRPSSGTILVGGFDTHRQAAAVRREVGLVGHQTYLYADMTVRENLQFCGRLYGVDHLEARIDDVLGAVDLAPRAHALVRTLSRGLQQRASLARAMLHEPTLLLLDEPEAGLDQASQQRLEALLAAWAAAGRAVLVATHRHDWVPALADRAIVLDGGRVVDSYMVQPPPEASAPGPGRPAVHATALRAVTRPALSGARRPGRGAFIRQVGTVLAKDLRIEWRTRDAFTAMLIFSFLVLVTFNFALDLRPEVMAAVGPGVLWVTVVFASTLGLGRTFAVERDQGTLEGLLLAPLDRSALFLAKLASNLALMLALEMVSLPVFATLFNVGFDLGPVAAGLGLGAVGLAAVGTLFSAIAAHTRAREVMLPVLLFPVIVPILIGVVQVTGLALGSGGARDMPWLSLLAAFAAMYVAAGALVFEYVLED